MSNPDGLPPQHQLVPTADGSVTLFSERFQEACHSTAGAKAETLHHYIDGCSVRSLFATLTEVRVFEVGFGTGLGWRETSTANLPTPAFLDFLSVEIDEELVKWAAPQLSRQTSAGLIWYESKNSKQRLRVLIGDARETLPHFLGLFPMTFHAIYQDAFSPKRNPTLWTEEWFKVLGTFTAPGAILSTYSASSSVRKALVNAGWGIQEGGPFGPKRSSTRARFGESSDPQLLLENSRSPIPACKDPL